MLNNLIISVNSFRYQQYEKKSAPQLSAGPLGVSRNQPVD
jgi:hypothetical protein